MEICRSDYRERYSRRRRRDSIRCSISNRSHNNNRGGNVVRNFWKCGSLDADRADGWTNAAARLAADVRPKVVAVGIPSTRTTTTTTKMNINEMIGRQWRWIGNSTVTAAWECKRGTFKAATRPPPTTAMANNALLPPSLPPAHPFEFDFFFEIAFWSSSSQRIERVTGWRNGRKSTTKTATIRTTTARRKSQTERSEGDLEEADREKGNKPNKNSWALCLNIHPMAPADCILQPDFFLLLFIFLFLFLHRARNGY